MTRSGLFVKLNETGADGFVPVSTIGHEYYRHDEALHALVGDRSGETYRLGDTVEVRLVEAAAVAGALRFEILSEGRSRTGAKGVGIKRSGFKARPGKAGAKAKGKTTPGKTTPGKTTPGKPRPGKGSASEGDAARRHRGSRR